MAQYTPAQLAELRELSTSMLDTIRRVIRDDPADQQKFLAQLHRLMHSYGMGGVAFAIRAWLDTAIEAFPHVKPGQIDGVVFTNTEGTAISDDTDMDRERRWAAAALAARMGADQVRLYQMIDSIQPAQASVFLLRVVELVAGVLNDKDGSDQPGFLRTGDILVVHPTAG